MNITLPEWKTFQSKTKDITPIHKFYDWLKIELGGLPENHQINVSSVVLNKADERYLKDMTKEYFIKVYKLEKDKAAKEAAWINLDIGPIASPDQNVGQVYIKKDVFRKVGNV